MGEVIKIIGKVTAGNAIRTLTLEVPFISAHEPGEIPAQTFYISAKTEMYWFHICVMMYA